MDSTMILCDNERYMKIIENHVFQDKMKHIEIHYLYIRDMVQKGAINLQYVRIDENVTDVLTNPLSHVKLEHFWDKLGVVCKDLPQNGEYYWWYYGILITTGSSVGIGHP